MALRISFALNNRGEWLFMPCQPNTIVQTRHAYLEHINETSSWGSRLFWSYWYAPCCYIYIKESNIQSVYGSWLSGMEELLYCSIQLFGKLVKWFPQSLHSKYRHPYTERYHITQILVSHKTYSQYHGRNIEKSRMRGLRFYIYTSMACYVNNNCNVHCHCFLFIIVFASNSVIQTLEDPMECFNGGILRLSIWKYTSNRMPFS